jgi:hypothetical protein
MVSLDDCLGGVFLPRLGRQRRSSRHYDGLGEIRVFCGLWGSIGIRAQDVHREEKRARENLSNPLTFLVELVGIEPTTS